MSGVTTQSRMTEFNLGGIATGNAPAKFEGEMWMVVKSNTTNGNAWSFGTSGSQSHFSWSGSIYEDFGRSVRAGPITPSTNIAASFNLYRVSAETGAQLVTVNNSPPSVNSSGVLAWRNDPSLANAWTGDIAEVLIRSQISTQAEATSLTTYFNTEHGLSAPAPSFFAQTESVYIESLATGYPSAQTESVYTESLITGAPYAQTEMVYVEVLAYTAAAAKFIGWGSPL